MKGGDSVAFFHTDDSKMLLILERMEERLKLPPIIPIQKILLAKYIKTV